MGIERSNVLALVGWAGLLALLVLAAGCTSRRAPLPAPPEVSQEGVAASLLVPADLNVHPKETVLASPGSERTASGLIARPELADPQAVFSLSGAIAFGLQNSPRLRSARAAVCRARGQEQVAFAPFLPQIDLLGQSGVVSSTLAPGVLGATGFILVDGFGTRSYMETEVALQWTLYDFGRTGGRYRQAVAKERIAALQLARADQTVEFEVTAAYLDVLLARASRRACEEAVHRAEAIQEDTRTLRQGGVALREDVMRSKVQLSESREALILAREREYGALARLNHAMGRNSGLPLEVIDLTLRPPMPGALAGLLQQAVSTRPEIALARQAVLAAQEGRQAARGEFLPRIYVRASAGRTEGEYVVDGWQEGVGLHLETPLYAGGRRRGELLSAEADIESAVADAQAILDAISLQVNLAYRGIVAGDACIDLAQTAVVEATENLRLVRVRYRNGNATPTDVVDGEAALTRSQQRFYAATYTYLVALARLDYALGRRQGACLDAVKD